MRRSLVAIFAVLLLATAAVASASDSRLQANKAAAQRDARKLLALLTLPKDIQRSVARPRVGGTLVGARSANSRFWAGDQAFWTTDANPRSIIDYVKAHRPAGSRLETWGSGSSPTASTLEVMFNWPALGLQAFNRTLTVSVVSGYNGGPSAVVAQSQSYWMVPRPSSERVPNNVRSVAITLKMGSGLEGTSGHMHISTYVLWRAARVAALVKLFDALPIVQPGLIMSCPAELVGNDRPALTLQFRAGPAGPALARAMVYVYPGAKGASGWNGCDPIEFSIGGKQQTALTSQTFVKHVGRLIGANIS